MDITQALKDAENALRDFIAEMLAKQFGVGWEEKCGVTAERVEKWRERKGVEAKRQETGIVDERLLYYADFYDLKSILKKHWSIFSPALGDLKTFEVWLGELEKLRDPDAHRRELLPHQRHLALGISGEIRTRIVRYRSEQDTSESYFPRLECVRDSLGDNWTPHPSGLAALDTKKNVRPGDTIEFVVTASDPQGERLQYCLSRGGRDETWQDINILSHTFTKADIGLFCPLEIKIRSLREYHAKGKYDDDVVFAFCVLPAKP